VPPFGGGPGPTGGWGVIAGVLSSFSDSWDADDVWPVSRSSAASFVEVW